VHRGAIGENIGFFRAFHAFRQGLLPCHDAPALLVFLVQDSRPSRLGDAANGFLRQVHSIIFDQVLASVVKRRNLRGQAAADFRQRPTDIVPQKAQHGVVRIAVFAAVLTPPARPTITHVADGGGQADLGQTFVPHRHATLGTARSRHLQIRHVAPDVQKMLRQFQQPVAQLHLRLIEIEQLLGQRLHQLLQLRHDFLMQFLQKSLLDARNRLCCTHSCTLKRGDSWDQAACDCSR
jgi:hypothetical protein